MSSDVRRGAGILGLLLAGAALVACRAAPEARPLEEAAKGAAPAGSAAEDLDEFYTNPEKFGIELPKHRGGIANYAANQTNIHLDPYLGPDFRHQIVLEFVFDSIVDKRYAPNVNPFNPEFMCRVCVRWQEPDEKTFVFHLRKNVKWHDGTPFSAADVKFSYDRMRDPKGGYNLVQNLDALDRVEVVDDFTAKVILKHIDPDFLWKLSDVFLMPKHAADAGVDFKKKAIGTGPFKVESYDADTKITYRKNETYYIPDRPWLDGVVMFFIGDVQTRLSALAAGRVDWQNFQDKVQAAPLIQANPKFQVQSFIANLGNSLFFRVDRPPFEDIRVRKALQLGIDRDLMNQSMAAGGGAWSRAQSSRLYPWALTDDEMRALPGWRKDKAGDYEEAKKLLAEAGFKDGLSFEGITGAASASLPQMLETASGQLRQNIGVTMRVNLLEPGVDAKRQAAGDFEATLRPSGARLPPSGAWPLVRSGHAANVYGVSDPRLDEMIDRQASTIDKSKRYPLLKEMQRYVIEQAYIVPFIELNPVSLWHPWLHNWRDYSQLAQPFLYAPMMEAMWVEPH